MTVLGIFLFCYIYITSFSQQSNSTFPRDFSIFSEKSLHTLQNSSGISVFDSDIIYLNQINYLSETKPYYFENTYYIISLNFEHILWIFFYFLRPYF